jgi:glycosyltransferase involved in cell wall biosynthesis
MSDDIILGPMHGAEITLVIPTIPPRKACLVQAMASAMLNTLPPAAYAIAVDTFGEGADVTRQRALDTVQTPYVAFMDDDDELMDCHFADLLGHLRKTEADMVYSYFVMVGGNDPFPPSHYTAEFDPANPIETTITTLCRTEAAKAVGFKRIPERLYNTGEDFNFVLGMVEKGFKISHLVKRTWYYNVHGLNTGGMAANWKNDYAALRNN